MNKYSLITIYLGHTTELENQINEIVKNGRQDLSAPTDIQDDQLYDMQLEDDVTPDQWWKDQFSKKESTDWVSPIKYILQGSSKNHG